jgi:16S rRNA (cytosine967-C5)-methyltransferase
MAGASPLAGPFDHVLLDAPCGGTGTLRRHPEIRWRLTPQDLPRLAARQAKLLDTAGDLVARGGTLVYSVCSLEPEEGEDAIASFLQRHPEFRRADAETALPPPARALLGRDGALRTFPDVGDLDGFYAVLLERTGGPATMRS